MIDSLYAKTCRRPHLRAVLPIIALLLAGCASQTATLPTTQSNPAVANAAAAIARPAAGQILQLETPQQTQKLKYVYVTDAKLKSLLVYRLDSLKNGPIRSVPFKNTEFGPMGVATDSHGKVYVAIFDYSQVNVYSPGARHLLRTIRAGLYKPMGVAIDTNDTLYVASHCNTPSCSAGYVLEYHPGADNAFRSVSDTVKNVNFAVNGVSVDSTGRVWMDSYNSCCGWGFRYVNGQWDGTTLQFISCQGIAVDNHDNVYAASGSALLYYAPNDERGDGTVVRKYGVGYNVRDLGRGPDGTIVVPVQSTASKYGPSIVDIIRPGVLAPTRISKGIKAPEGGAVGY